jgi:hypothetical protein
MDRIKFNSIRDVINYCPKCIFCGKEYVYDVYCVHSKFNFFDYVRVVLIDNYFISDHHEANIIIDIDSNKFISDHNSVKEIFSLRKKCISCNMKIMFEVTYNINPTSIIGQLVFHRWITYKTINKSSNYYIDCSMTYDNTYINKSLLPFILDLSEFNNKTDFFNKIKLITTFI